MIYIFFYKLFYLIMNNKITSRKAKNVATANYNSFTKKKFAGDTATSNIFTSIKNAKDTATKNS